MIIKNCARTSSAKPPRGSKYHFYPPVALTAFCPGSKIVHLGFQMGRVDSQWVQLAFRMDALAPRWSNLHSGWDALDSSGYPIVFFLLEPFLVRMAWRLFSSDLCCAV